MNKIAIVALTAVGVAVISGIAISGIAIAACSKHAFEDTFLV